ncbi:TonB-dependent receptor [Aquimarina sp. AD1]|uniref:TonB-dependent receptor n=1 Tax=Aquimarina sp. (strain AD1) TaxID=1714848 RepID=UPI000E4D4EAD|nr:TonB-dependent receptor [Aquimarina sp. AD1]AXT58551.1 TonB-dependent receptor [Aquimarina sp. AD1]RKN24351.1 PEGA domain-containing protein [Aquimarina sp. AD1]
MIKKIVYLLFLCTLGTIGQEQFTISGYIKDVSSGEKLLGVNIIIDNSIGTTTNDYGFYSMNIEKGTHQIEISYLGYKTILKEIQITNNQKIDFNLTEELAQLDEIIISSNNTRKKIESTEMSVISLQGETIKKMPAILGEPDVLKSLQLLPGVSSVNEASSGFNVRGGSVDQNLILLDEATIYNASHLFGFFSVFNSDAIKNAKLYKGGIPAIYGGRLSSVLDIKQKEGNTKKFGGNIGIGLISAKALIEGPILKGDKEEASGSYMLAGRRSYIDLFSFLLEDFEDSSLFFYDFNLKANYDLNKNNRLFLSGYFGRDTFELDGLLGTTWGNTSGTLRWTSVINEKLFLQTSAIFSNYEYNLDNLRTGSEFRWKSSITNYNLKPKLSWYINNNNTLKTGVDMTYYQFKPGKISSLNGSSINGEEFSDKFGLENGVYVDLKQKLSNKLSVQYGLRWSNFFRLGSQEINQYETGTPLTYYAEQDIYEENEVIGTTQYGSGDNIKSFNGIEPRVSARYLLNDSNSFKLSYNRMYQYLHLISNTTSPTPLDVWSPSGPYIKPQYADQLALGYFTSFNKGKYDLSLETYYKKLNDVTDFIDGADLIFTEEIETQIAQGEGRAYGLEVQLNKNEGRLTGWLSYTLAKSETKVLGINNNEYYPSNSDQLHKLNLVGFYKLNKRWDFGANFVFGSGRPVTYPTGRYEQNGLVVADYNNRNGNRLPAYHRLDISATLNPKKGKNGKWVFSLVNVYNRQNAASIYFNEVGEVGDQEIATGMTQATKLSFFGIVPSISYEFKF